MSLLITRKDFVWYLINEETNETIMAGEISEIAKYIKELKINKLNFDV